MTFSCEKRKQRSAVYEFHSFGEPGYPICPVGPFRDNIRLFLQQCSEPESHEVQGIPMWCTRLVDVKRNLIVPLYTIEENVSISENPFCVHCQCTGWSNHFVSKRNYHLIISMDDDWNKPLDYGVLSRSTHLLHGLIHCNGFAHLLCINGREGGSKNLCGRELMDFWDRICTTLQTRKITVEDASKKQSMELRLLHGVAYGHPWFGKWGYRFCHGSVEVKEHTYERALEILSSLELEKIIQDFSDTDQSEELMKIVHHYRHLSEKQLVTIKDLFRFMLTVKGCVPAERDSLFPAANPADMMANAKPAMSKSLEIKLMKENCSKYRKFASAVSNMNSRWSARRLNSAADVIVNTLKEKEEKDFDSGRMARRDVRDAARWHIKDRVLLDYILESLNNVVVGNQVVCLSVNPTNHFLECTVHDLDGGDKVSEPGEKILPPLPPPPAPVSRTVNRDILYLYEHILLGYPKVELAMQAVLDTKYFIKENSLRDDEEHLVTLFCQILPVTDEKIEFRRELPPGEMVLMEMNATIGELKQEAESYFVITEHIVVLEIEGLEFADDAVLLSTAIQSGTEVGVRVSGVDWYTPLRYQGGSDSPILESQRCQFRPTYNDDERMVACDICEVWPHRCCHGLGYVDECGRELSIPRPMKLLEGRVKGSTNIALCSSEGMVFGSDTRTSITWPLLPGQSVASVTIKSEEESKVKLFHGGGVAATMTGDVAECKAIWKIIQRYIDTHPNTLSMYNISKAAHDHVCSLKGGSSGIFIGSLKNKIPILYRLDNVNRRPRVHLKLLELLSGASFAIGSGAIYTHRELEKWNKISVEDGIKRVLRALVAAAFECPYTGGYIDIYCCNSSENTFKLVRHIKVLEAYKLEYADLHDDNDKSIFFLYSNNLKETDIRSIHEVSQYGHDVAKTLSGLFVRRITFRDKKSRDEFFVDSYCCKRLPDIFYDTRTRDLKPEYRHFKLMCYKRINSEIAFFSKPSLEFLHSFETDLVTSKEFFPVQQLLNW